MTYVGSRQFHSLKKMESLKEEEERISICGWYFSDFLRCETLLRLIVVVKNPHLKNSLSHLYSEGPWKKVSNKVRGKSWAPMMWNVNDVSRSLHSGETKEMMMGEKKKKSLRWSEKMASISTKIRSGKESLHKEMDSSLCNNLAWKIFLFHFAKQKRKLPAMKSKR